MEAITITLEEAMTATDATVDLDWCNRNARGFMAIRVLRAEVAKLRKRIESFEREIDETAEQFSDRERD